MDLYGAEKLYKMNKLDNESLTEFHTRVANEIRAMDCKIVKALFYPDIALIAYKNRIKVNDPNSV